jgi:hypothetical protein
MGFYFSQNIKMTKYKQSNIKWGGEELDKSGYFLDYHGCLITALASIADIEPDIVNGKMNSVGGITKKGWVVWGKISKAGIGLDFISRVRVYSNGEVLKAIKDYGFCLIEVDWDGNPRTEGRHWVIGIGGGKIIDPISGREAKLSKYSLLKGYAIIRKSSTDGGDMNKELKACLEALHGEKGVIKEKEALQRKYDEDIEKLNNTIADKQKEIDSLKPKVNTAESKAQEWEINFKEFVNSLASKLGCKHDRAAITAEVEGLITIEDQKTTCENELDELAGSHRKLEYKIVELEDKLESEVKPVSKKKIDFKHALWEAAKEPLRWLTLAVIPVLATYLARQDMQWAVYATVALRMIDKVLHQADKIDPKTKLIKLPF